MKLGTVPAVSIGVPVFNGEAYLASALDSILAQTFDDFEIIISDNASTDGTRAICEEYAARDQRIRYFRSARNEGASANFNLTFKHSRGRYFRWHAADDVLAPDYLLETVAVLEHNPDTVLCHSDVEIIDREGTSLLQSRYPEGYAQGDAATDRLRDVLALDRWCYDIFGLVRREIMAQTGLLPNYIASDRVTRAELALRGKYYIIPRALFLNRDHENRSVRAMPSHHQRGAWFDPALEGKQVFPRWRILGEYWRCVGRAPLSRAQRRACRVVVAGWVLRDKNWGRLAIDAALGLAPWSWTLLRSLSHWRNAWLESGATVRKSASSR
jgi:glycosyltransferase involved in cell wall biosynthesis